MAAHGTSPRDGIELARIWLANSPFCARLGVELVALEVDRAELLLPFSRELTTYGDVVHGAAVSGLVDVAATAASWAGDDLSRGAVGATVSLTVEMLRATRATDIRAVAKVMRRGRNLCFSDVELTQPDGALAAKGLVTYKIGL